MRHPATGPALPARQDGGDAPTRPDERRLSDPQRVWAEAQRSRTERGADAPVKATVAEHGSPMDDPRFEPHPENDLPKSFLRERAARQRAAETGFTGGDPGDPSMTYRSDRAPGEGVTVDRIEVPFFRLVMFFLKCAFAAIPALILLGLFMFAIGQAAQMMFPWLVKMRILITFP